MNKIFSKLFSMKIGVILLFIFGLSCAIATFIENDFGTESAFALVYGALWFEALQLYLGFLVFYNFFRYKLFRKEKLPSLIFHLAFLIILLGSAFTRYFGFEGTIHIREGQSESRILSSEPHIQIKAIKDKVVYTNNIKKLFSQIKLGNFFTLPLQIGDKKATFTYKNLIQNATQKFIQASDGEPIISLVISDGKTAPRELTLREGQTKKISDIIFAFKPPKIAENNVFYLYQKNGKFYFYSNKSISWFKMSDNSKGKYQEAKQYPFTQKQLYTIDTLNVVPKAIFSKAKESWVEAEMSTNNSNKPSVLIGELTFNGETKEVALLGRGRGYKGLSTDVLVGGQHFTLEWGSKAYELPFALKLIDFQLERYAGSMSPSSYASEVRIIDKKQNINMPFRIYMNHVLDYRGFRFFQSSYDRDELGTILAVNKDPGKYPTYVGYFLLFLGLIINILNPKSRFRKLSNAVNQESLKQKSKTIAIIAFALGLFFSKSPLEAAYDVDKYDKEHANLFGMLIVQSNDGRMKPINTLAHEVLNKVYRHSSYKGVNANQVLLGMITAPYLWQDKPMIKIYDKKLKKIIGVKESATHASFNKFFEASNAKKYKLMKYAEEANYKKPSQRNLFDKDVLKVDERLNICYLVYTGEILKMIPKIGDKNKKWYSPTSAITWFPKQEANTIKLLLEKYFESVAKGLENGDWREADAGVKNLMAYQKQFGNDMVPSKSRVKVEINFNNLQIFLKLTPVYLICGLLLLFIIFLRMLFPSINLKWPTKIGVGIVTIAFITHTIGLGMRWYISKHAPWSDSYESMIYIAWALALSGILFSRKSPISLALTAILTGITLFVAHLAWMDPQITNLVPVLKSYWLTIHVSVITASYGFFGLCALLGFFTLILFIIKNPKRNDKRSQLIDANINEATKINEMAMILGLTLLTIGNFLGGIWANESWGRYWGWDAKETWALISILIYACVVHFRFIPKLNNQYAFAVASTFAFWSILMTYFGVNFYLSGMHSYAAGDPIPIPVFVPIAALVMFSISVLAFFKRKTGKTLQ